MWEVPVNVRPNCRDGEFLLGVDERTQRKWNDMSYFQVCFLGFGRGFLSTFQIPVTIHMFPSPGKPFLSKFWSMGGWIVQLCFLTLGLGCVQFDAFEPAWCTGSSSPVSML